MSFYKKQLEQAREALLSRGGIFSVPTAKEQVKVQEEGLMRPKAAKEAPKSEGLSSGLGLALMKTMRPEGRPEHWNPEITQPTQEDRPSARRSGDANSFRDRLKRSESSGDSEVQIKLEDGRTMTGAYQFGDARLKDYMKANKTKFTTEQFRKNPDLQEEVFQWHMKDIDDKISDLKGAKGMSRDGLRAVAHLGGKTGMIKYVQSGGKYNPADDFGTKLSDYYNKFK